LCFLALQQQDAEIGRGIGSGAGAAVAVGRREIADGLATDEIVDERPVVDESHGLRFNTVVVDPIGAYEALALKVVQGRVVDDA